MEEYNIREPLLREFSTGTGTGTADHSRCLIPVYDYGLLHPYCTFDLNGHPNLEKR